MPSGGSLPPAIRSMLFAPSAVSDRGSRTPGNYPTGTNSHFELGWWVKLGNCRLVLNGPWKEYMTGDPCVGMSVDVE